MAELKLSQISEASHHQLQNETGDGKPTFQLSQIEDFFNEQRAKAHWPHRLLDSKDWHLMLAWQEENVPLAVICRGIEEMFTKRLQAGDPDKQINTLRYCKRAINRHWKEHLAAHVGGHGSDATTGHQAEFGFEHLSQVLQNWIEQIQRLSGSWTHHPEATSFTDSLDEIGKALCDLKRGLSDPINLEALDTALGTLEGQLMIALKCHAGASKIEQLTHAAKQMHAKYKDTMMDGIWQETIQKAIEKKLREEYDIPRLSLFYL